MDLTSTGMNTAAYDVDATADLEGPAPAHAATETVLGERPQLLGQGGNAEVVLGIQASLSREVAVKRLQVSRHTPTARAALIAEARLTGQLEHPNIVPVHDLRVDDEGWPYIVLKRVQGQSWKGVLEEERRSGGGTVRLERHLRILLSVCDAVRFAHSRGVVHLDLKPSNVLLGDFGEVYVSDWGSAIELEAPQMSVTLAPDSSIRGTPYYLSPELARAGQGTVVDVRADVYGLGAILAELVLGQALHADASPVEAVARQARGQLDHRVGAVPGELGELLRRALTPGVDARCPSVDSFRASVLAYLEHQEARGLAADAASRLGVLKEVVVQGGDWARIHDAFVECRYACTESLNRLADQPEVRAINEEAHAVTASAALVRGDLAMARSLLSAMRGPPADLEAALAQAEALRGSDAQELRGLREVAREEDLELGTERRRRALVAGAVLAPLPAAVVLAGNGFTLDPRVILVADVLFGVGMAVLGALAAPSLLVNRASRRMGRLLWLETGLSMFATVLVSLRGGTVADVVLARTVVVMGANAAGFVLADQRLLAATLTQVVLCAGLIAWPGLTTAAYLVMPSLALGSLALFPQVPVRTRAS